MQGQLWIVAAPSGGGKTSLIAETRRVLNNVVESVSYTTREHRNGEINGVHYHFVTKEVFAVMKEKGDFLEYAEVFHNYYGTSESYIDGLLNQGLDVILSIDWQGAQQVRKKRSDVKTVFLLPPSLSALRERLEKRGQDFPDIVEKRMIEAKEQISHYKEFDFVIINDDFNVAAKNLQCIIQAHRLERKRQNNEIELLIKKLETDRF
ncbi:MAG: guanylate kinase [Cardiobacteriaceae bacterium]|nr:guanylate kinase [Cardiobacteriaceae bacterium]